MQNKFQEWYMYISSRDLPPVVIDSITSMREMMKLSWRRHQMETFSALLAICAGNSPVPVNSPHKGQWRRALMFSLICVWINGWVNNREAGDLRRYRAHYDVTIMMHYMYGNVCIPMSNLTRARLWLGQTLGRKSFYLNQSLPPFFAFVRICPQSSMH